MVLLDTDHMNSNDVSEFSRAQVRALGLGATTLEEIEQTRQMLKNWRNAHPQEPKLTDVFEQLYIMEDAWRSLAAEPTSRAA